jgi:alpha-methylacyl-CoA racemase
VARGTFVEVGGVKQPGPAPRFSRTPCEVVRPPPAAGEHTDAALAEWGFSRQEIAQLRDAKAVA